MISKYSVFFVGTRRINAIFMSKKFSVPLTSESVYIRSGWRSFPSTFFTVYIPLLNEKRQTGQRGRREEGGREEERKRTAGGRDVQIEVEESKKRKRDD